MQRWIDGDNEWERDGEMMDGGWADGQMKNENIGGWGN